MVSKQVFICHKDGFAIIAGTYSIRHWILSVLIIMIQLLPIAERRQKDSC
jgi:hypothetical protein